MNTTFYQFKAKSIQGKEVSMETYKEKEFVILGFPCNQFANQEPGDEKSIAEGRLTGSPRLQNPKKLTNTFQNC
ncbi:MAG: hypothetical protein WC377_06445 [Bacteroidales bacterium]|jgi:glutathione peroxidase|nr:hypothetical protein [Bacteroidales bacterium]MDD2824241.1 hypothetical protein [Bacteroidales bacterium]MDD3101014.1 hypothetical protein [Bacteroidales bacterium]MDD3639903.1 hypothetical protein [Bacteroidales bacterium]MDD3944868.1 hypothetical protein [Bacteroidales bacterium]